MLVYLHQRRRLLVKFDRCYVIFHFVLVIKMLAQRISSSERKGESRYAVQLDETTHHSPKIARRFSLHRACSSILNWTIKSITIKYHSITHNCITVDRTDKVCRFLLVEYYLHSKAKCRTNFVIGGNFIVLNTFSSRLHVSTFYRTNSQWRSGLFAGIDHIWCTKVQTFVSISLVMYF